MGAAVTDLSHYAIVDGRAAPPGAPFARGDVIVARDNPEQGALNVIACRFAFAHWRVDATGPGYFSDSPAANFVLAPEGWTDPPLAPHSFRDALGSSTDGPISLADWAEAKRQDAARVDDRIRHAHALADWWRDIGALIAPERAKQQAAGLRLMATHLAEEAKS